MSKLKGALASLILFVMGVAIGGYSFSQTQSRSFLSINQCQDCFTPKELAGLLASVGINMFSGLIPGVVFETDKTIVIKNPFRVRELQDGDFAAASIDYVIFPKKDIKNIGEISAEDAPYIIDAYLTARHIIEENKATNYRLLTNGPGFQDISYLHFHLLLKTFGNQGVKPRNSRGMPVP
jgi:sulfur carrier protein ThiS